MNNISTAGREFSRIFARDRLKGSSRSSAASRQYVQIWLFLVTLARHQKLWKFVVITSVIMSQVFSQPWWAGMEFYSHRANLHRIVITPDGPEKTKRFFPMVLIKVNAGLWQWLENTEKVIGARFLAIPHNSSMSKGYMFDNTT